MPMSLPGRPLLALPVIAPLCGCVDRPPPPPPPRPIALNPPHYHRQLRARQTTPAQDVSQPAPAPTEAPAQELSPEERESLLRDFNAYLNRPGHQP